MMTKFIEMLRDMFAESENKRIENFDVSLKQRGDIIRYGNLIYGQDLEWNVLDIYRPKNREGEKIPVIINVHGGGWIYGSKEGYQYYCMTLASMGYAVINFNYRLAPKFHFPAPIEDLNTLMYWLFTNGETYHLDLEHIYSVGDSAGAHILGLYAAMCTNEEYAANFSFQIPKKNVFEAIALNCGVYFSNSEKRKTDFVRILAYAYLGLEDRENDKNESKEYQENCAKVIDLFEFVKYVNEQYPDTFVMTSANDFAKTDSVRLAARLVEQSVNSELRMYVSKDHDLEHVFHCDLRLDEAKICNQAEIAFFQKHNLWKTR
jgi:acetyl esterase/lipase